MILEEGKPLPGTEAPDAAVAVGVVVGVAVGPPGVTVAEGTGVFVGVGDGPGVALAAGVAVLPVVALLNQSYK